MKSNDTERLGKLINKNIKEWGEAPRIDFHINGEIVSFDAFEISGFSSNNKIEINLVLENEDEVDFVRNDVLKKT